MPRRRPGVVEAFYADYETIEPHDYEFRDGPFTLPPTSLRRTRRGQADFHRMPAASAISRHSGMVQSRVVVGVAMRSWLLVSAYARPSYRESAMQ